MPTNRVSIFDTTLRDGEQSPGCSMNLTEKVRMANKLQDLGVDIIEAGFPIASDGDFAAVKAIAAQCQEVKVAALCRTAEQAVAVANTLAAIEAGARQVECTINGIGERAGNASLEEIVMALHVRADRLPFETGIKTTELYPTSQLLSSIVGFDVQPNKAIVGRNAFAHEAGIHQHGVINNPLCYEIMTPESDGVPANSLVLGKHSGRHALSLRYTELGYDITSAELDAAYTSFTNLADKKKRIYDQDLISLLSAVTRECAA